MKMLGQIPGMIRKLDSRFMFPLYPASPDCGEDAVGRILDEDVGGGFTEIASGEPVDGNAFHSWSCCESLNNKWWTNYYWQNGCMRLW